MTKLSDTQAVILSAAAQRDDGAVLPLPETLKIKGGAVAKVLGSLKAKGLIDHQGTPRGDDPPPLRITRAGLEAIGVEPEARITSQPMRPRRRQPPRRTRARRRPMPVSRRCKPPAHDDRSRQCGHACREQGKGEGANAKAAKRGKAVPAEKPTPRAGTKQALMIDLLKRPEGATVEQIAAGHRLAAPHHPRRHLRRAQEKARPHRRGHAHPRSRPEQNRRQGQQHGLPDRRLTFPLAHRVFAAAGAPRPAAISSQPCPRGGARMRA